MNRFFIEISLENEAFANNASEEVARILREIANKVGLFSWLNEKTAYPVRDINGNKVGQYGYEVRQ